STPVSTREPRSWKLRPDPTKSWRQVGVQREELTVLRYLDAVQAQTEELRHRESRERAGELRDERPDEARQHGFQLRLVRPERVVDDAQQEIGGRWFGERDRKARTVGQEIEVHTQTGVERTPEPDRLGTRLDDLDGDVCNLQLSQLAVGPRIASHDRGE